MREHFKKYVLLFISVVLLAYFYFRQSKEVRTTQNLPGLTPSPEANKQRQLQVRLSKTEKAIEVTKLNQKSRQPSAQLKVVPEALSESPLFADSSWKIWRGVKAVRSDQKNAADQVVGELSHQSLVVDQNFKSDLTQFDSSEWVVVYDTRLKRPGLLTGALKLQTADRKSLDEDIKTSESQIVDSFETIQTYFITSQNRIFNLEALYFFFKSKSYIQSIELDVIDRNYEKK